MEIKLPDRYLNFHTDSLKCMRLSFYSWNTLYYKNVRNCPSASVLLS